MGRRRGDGLAEGGEERALALEVGEKLGLAGLLLLDDRGGGLAQEGLVAELGLHGAEEALELRDLVLRLLLLGLGVDRALELERDGAERGVGLHKRRG